MDINSELKELLEIKAILSDPKFTAYIDKVKSMYEFTQAKVDSMTSTYIPADKLADLNFAVAQRNALGTLLLAKDEMEDQISPVDDLALSKLSGTQE